MSWVNDLTSAIGLPAGATTIAVAMYGACAAAEKAARPEALADIGRILKDPGWERSVRPAAIIERVFNWTFGERHVSWKCVTRSVCATIIFVTAFVITLYLTQRRLPFDKNWGAVPFGVPIVTGTIEVIFVGFLADYVALWKTRLLLQVSRRQSRPGLLLVPVDILLSLFISICFLEVHLTIFTYWFPYYHRGGLVSALLHSTEAALWWILSPAPENYSFYICLLLSTLTTSLWTVLVLLSTTAIKMLAPVHQFTTWFFDVEKHPVQSIGIVAGALVIVGSFVWSLAEQFG
jgi:hypothetical protein